MKNKFLVGDRVRIRGTNLKARITNKDGEECFVIYDNGYENHYHCELLIKLKKKQRLEGWVNVCDGIAGNILYKSKDEALKHHRLYGVVLAVKMREVRE